MCELEHFNSLVCYSVSFTFTFKFTRQFSDILHKQFCVIFVKVKVKCTLVQALKLCTGRTAHRGSRGIAIPFHDHGTRRGGGFSVTPRPLFTPGKDPVPIIQEVGWAPGPVWTGAENLAPTGIRFPDCPAPKQSIYRLSYRGHYYICAGKLQSTYSFVYAL